MPEAIDQLEHASAAATLFLAVAKANAAKADLSGASLADGGLKTPEQGNPKPFETKFRDIPVHVDRPRGFVQKGKDAAGKPWERTYLTDYGYVPGVKALLTPTVTDEEDLDVYLGPEVDAPDAHLVLQVKADGTPDELKAMLGYKTPDAAKKMFVAHTPEKHFGGMATMPIEMFKALLGLGELDASKALGGVVKALWSVATMQKLAGVSYDDLNRAIRETLAALYPPGDGGMTYCGPWICDTYDDTVVFESEGKLMRVGFAYTAGKASFVGEPVQVVRTYTPIAEVAAAKLRKEERSAKLVVAKAAPAEERYVLGIVLEPEVVDAQGDIYSADEIKKTAHEYMKLFRNVGLMHKALVNGRATIVQSFLAPVDMEIEGSKIKKGAWLLGIEVTDDSLWKQIKAGELTGLSIGGFAKRSPVVS